MIVFCRLSAFLLIAQWVFGIVGSGVIVYSTFDFVYQFTKLGVGLLVFGVVLGVLQYVAASLTKCPLCLARILLRSRCVKHHRTRRIFGSDRLITAFSIIFKGRFCCPYCHERVQLQLRKRGGPLKAAKSSGR